MLMMTIRPARILAVCSLLMPVTVSAQRIDTTEGVESPARQIGMFTNDMLEGAYHSTGQTFRVPVGFPQLDAFSFWLNGNANISFQAYVMAWDEPARRARGSVLWSSEVLVGPHGNTRYDFETGGLILDPTQMYIAFLSMSEHFEEMSPGQNALLGYQYNPYFGGRFYEQTTGSDIDNWTDAGWSRDLGCEDCDAAFIADFSEATATPEPITMGLTALGLSAVGAARNRRRKLAR
jgi:hypothetical protein